MPRYARLSLLFACFLALGGALAAALPELSSIEPLEFDEAAGRLVARGDARLEFGNTRVRADRIAYYRDYNLADALGAVTVTRDGYRLIADRLNFDATENVFAVDLLRTGRWPFYLSGVSAGGSLETAELEGGTLYYGNPGPFALSVSAPRIRYARNGGDPFVRMERARFRIGDVPFFFLPGYTHYLREAPYFFEMNAGFDGELGAYLQTTTLLPTTSWLRSGANFDLYSKRGLLAGPAGQYVFESGRHQIVGALSSGYINDQGTTGEDILNDPIAEDRGFVEWRHRQRFGDRFQVTGVTSYWSDSEVTRDFREAYFDNNQQPDTFVEGVFAGDNYYLSAFGRFQPNDFQLVQERLPEVRFDLLPVPVFKTGAYHQLGTSYARLREDFGRIEPLIPGESEADRLDLNYRLERPVRLRDWLTLTPLAGARVTHYENQESFVPGLNPDASSSREIFEFGFDLTGRAYAGYPTVNRTWDIDGLRHIVRPVLRYRYYTDPEAAGEIASIDREAFDLNRPVLDLNDLRNIDTIPETHLARLGVENLFQTRAEAYGSRTLAALNFYQDILFDTRARYDGSPQETFNASWVELVLNPAPWLKFDLAGRFRTEALQLEELRTRTLLQSGEIWSLGLSTDLLNDRIEQYRLDFRYRINERYSLLSDVRFDADSGEWTRGSFGLQTRLGSTWEILYALTFREDARREDDVEFNVRVRLADH